MANGTNIGLRPTVAITEDFGGIVQQGVQGLIAERERKKADEEAKRKQAQEFEDRYGIEEDLYFLEDTEFRSVNDATTEALAGYRDRYYDVFKQLERDPSNIELKKRLGNITNSVKRMRSAHEKFVGLGKQGLELMSSDKLSGVDEETWREQLEAFDEGRIKIRLDDKDNMQFLFYNEEGGLSQVVPYNELVRGDLIERVDVDAEVEGMLKLIGRDKFDSATGRFITTSDVWGQSQDIQARTLIRQNIQSDEVMADLLNQATNGVSKKRKDFDEEDRQKVENYLVDSVKNAFGETRALRERAYPPQTKGTVGKGGAIDPVSVELIQPATKNGKPSITSDGRFVFTIGQGIAIDPTKSDRKIDKIEATADGRIMFRGEDREKVKDVPPSEKAAESLESVAKENNLNVEDIIEILNGDGSVTYYKRVPFDVDANEIINKVGNIFGVNDEDGLRDVLYQKFIAKFGKEEADRYFGGDLTPKTKPKEIFTAPTKKESGKQASAENRDPLNIGI